MQTVGSTIRYTALSPRKVQQPPLPKSHSIRFQGNSTNAPILVAKSPKSQPNKLLAFFFGTLLSVSSMAAYADNNGQTMPQWEKALRKSSLRIQTIPLQDDPKIQERVLMEIVAPPPGSPMLEHDKILEIYMSQSTEYAQFVEEDLFPQSLFKKALDMVLYVKDSNAQERLLIAASNKQPSLVLTFIQDHKESLHLSAGARKQIVDTIMKSNE